MKRAGLLLALAVLSAVIIVAWRMFVGDAPPGTLPSPSETQVALSSEPEPPPELEAPAAPSDAQVPRDALAADRETAQADAHCEALIERAQALSLEASHDQVQYLQLRQLVENLAQSSSPADLWLAYQLMPWLQLSAREMDVEFGSESGSEDRGESDAVAAQQAALLERLQASPYLDEFTAIGVLSDCVSYGDACEPEWVEQQLEQLGQTASDNGMVWLLRAQAVAEAGIENLGSVSDNLARVTSASRMQTNPPSLVAKRYTTLRNSGTFDGADAFLMAFTVSAPAGLDALIRRCAEAETTVPNPELAAVCADSGQRLQESGAIGSTLPMIGAQLGSAVETSAFRDADYTDPVQAQALQDEFMQSAVGQEIERQAVASVRLLLPMVDDERIVDTLLERATETGWATAINELLDEQDQCEAQIKAFLDEQW